MVFLGTVLDHDDDGSGKFTQGTSYLVRVDEAFKGLTAEQKEVFIDPGSFTSCYTHYTVGQQYLFYAGRYLALPGQDKGKRGKWGGKSALKTYGAAMCSGSRLAKDAGEHLAWIRDRSRGEQPTRVFGNAFQLYSRFGRPDENVPLAGARITLQQGAEKRVAIAGPAGEYEFAEVTPGKYELYGELRPWDASYRDTITVAPGGCVQRFLRMQGHGQVRGTLIDQRGGVVRGVRVELVRVMPDGKLARSYSLWSDTDAAGRFHFKDTPAGEFAIGVNLASAPTADEPWPATALAQGNVILQPNEEKSGLVLQLPQALPVRTVRVHVLWADGSPAEGGARAYSAADGYQYAYLVGTRAQSGNIVELQLMQHLSYKLRADWYQQAGDKPLHFQGEEIALAAGGAAVDVRIRLKVNRPGVK